MAVLKISFVVVMAEQASGAISAVHVDMVAVTYLGFKLRVHYVPPIKLTIPMGEPTPTLEWS